MANGNGKAFDFARGNMFMVDPMEVCIIGGKDLPPDERGPLDTDDPGPSHPLYDERLLTEEITEDEVANTDSFGVIEPIQLVKRVENGVELACVNNGRVRIRRARLVNRRRKKSGLAPLKVAAVNLRGDDLRQMGVMIAANQHRHNDPPTVVIEKLKRYMSRGVTLEDACPLFNLKLSTARQLLAYDDNASPEVKKAVEAGKIDQTAAAEIVRAGSPDKQREALGAALAAAPTGKKASKRTAKAAAKKAKKGADTNVGIADKGTQRKLLAAAERTGSMARSENSMHFWEGFENALKVVLGDGELDPRAVAIVKELS